jgi:hypothetical protein
MNINLPSFLMSLFILALIGFQIYNGRVSVSRSIRSHPDWTRKNYPYSFWVVISVQLALAVFRYTPATTTRAYSATHGWQVLRQPAEEIYLILRHELSISLLFRTEQREEAFSVILTSKRRLSHR